MIKCFMEDDTLIVDVSNAKKIKFKTSILKEPIVCNETGIAMTTESGTFEINKMGKLPVIKNGNGLILFHETKPNKYSDEDTSIDYFSIDTLISFFRASFVWASAIGIAGIVLLIAVMFFKSYLI